MRKILIVGHPSSRYAEVEGLLSDCGMGTAKPSRREGMMPSDIGATLMKAHGVTPPDALDWKGGIGQLRPAPLWNGMALDLMLGNVDQPLWGWSDPRAVYFLDYWRQLDPSITFVLVYDGPGTALPSNGQVTGPITAEVLQQSVRTWCEYNAELLRFFHRNSERSLLVHGGQVRLSAQQCLQEVCACMEAPATESAGLLEASERPRAPVLGSPRSVSTPDSSLLNVAEPAATVTSCEPKQDPLEQFLADAVLHGFPEALQIYEELQSVASLPLVHGVNHGGGNELTGESAHGDHGSQRSVFEAWQSMVELKRLTQRQHADLKLFRTQVQGAEARVHEEQMRLSELRSEVSRNEEHSRQRVAELEAAREFFEKERRESTEENDLLLAQLHQVQEELERHYLQGQEQKDRIQSLLKVEKQAADRQKQLAELQQKLAEKEKLAKQAADRQKQLAELQQKLAEKEKLAERAKQSQKASRELEEENGLLLEQLHEVQEELERYYIENQALKGTGLVKVDDASRAMTRYGAADRVKGWLSYRLGAVMIERGRSIGGWVTMPWALLSEVRRFRRELPERNARKLPPISRYADAEEAERVKRHLSYRLGTALIANVRNPLRWVILPWALLRQVREFRSCRQT